jgi:hypothetical protein
MPKLNRAKDAHFYITHGFSIRNRDVVKNYQIDDAGLKVLYQKGFRAGDSIPHDIFHRLFEEGHVFYEREESLDPSQKKAPIDLHDRIRGFFLSQELESKNIPNRINVFKTLVIEAIRIEDSDVRNEIFIDLGVRTRSLPQPSEFRNFLVSKCPGSVCRDMKIIFKLDDESFESIRSVPIQGEAAVEEMVPKPEITQKGNLEKEQSLDSTERDEMKESLFHELRRILNQCAYEIVEKGITVEINIKISK